MKYHWTSIQFLSVQNAMFIYWVWQSLQEKNKDIKI